MPRAKGSGESVSMIVDGTLADNAPVAHRGAEPLSLGVLDTSEYASAMELRRPLSLYTCFECKDGDHEEMPV